MCMSLTAADAHSLHYQMEYIQLECNLEKKILTENSLF
jgi:hypothetical protein